MAISINSGEYTTSTTHSGDQIWYYCDNDLNMVQGITPPAPLHNHGFDSWQAPSVKRIEVQPSDNVVIYGNGGVELMKFNEGVEMKVNGKWVKVEPYLERIDELDKMMESMYQLLSPWQRKKLMFEQLEKQDKEFKHFDPDLFKV